MYSKWWQVGLDIKSSREKERLNRTIITKHCTCSSMTHANNQTKNLWRIYTFAENSLVLGRSGRILTTRAVVTSATVARWPAQAGTSTILARCAQLAVVDIILLRHIQVGAHVTRHRCVAADGTVVSHRADVASHAISWGGTIGLQCAVVAWIREREREDVDVLGK